MDDNIGYASALDLRSRFQERSLSPVEVTRALLERIERVNPSLTAYATVSADLALQQAAAAAKENVAGADGRY